MQVLSDNPALQGLAPRGRDGSKLTVIAAATAGSHAAALTLLEASGCEVRRIPEDAVEWDEDLIADYAPAADAWLGTFRLIGLPRTVLSRAPRTRVIVSNIIGTESFDVAAATDLSMVVAHGAMAENFDGMAEAGVMLIAALVKDLPGKISTLAAGRWKPVPSGRLVSSMTIGIVGLGRIGQGIAQRLKGWNCTIIAFDPYLDPAVAARLGVALVEIDSLLARSDVVMPLVTLSEKTRNLIDGTALRKMKQGSYLINIGRGGCVDEAALLDALDHGHLAGAALDTWATEPLPLDHPLRLHPRVIATGHVVGHSEELYARLPEVAAQNVLLGLAGRDPLYIRNPEVLPAWRERFQRLFAAV